MTDSARLGAPGMDEPSPPASPDPQPPPLDAIRVRPGGVRGLNKPAILIAAGGGLAAMLVLASGALNGDPGRKPADTKPMMSDPARPEMAKGAIRDLPADYAQAAARQPVLPAAPPLLGPPLPGDVAAFAPPHVGFPSTAPPDNGWSDPPGMAPSGSDSWERQQPVSSVSAGPTDEEKDIAEADSSGLFFALREQRDLAQQALQPVLPSPRQAGAPARQEATGLPAPAGPALFPGTVIPASLLTDINSETPGPVIAQVTQATYDSETGRSLMVPQGARLIGEYGASTRYGQSRVAVLWSRLILPDGREIALDEMAVDRAGTAGIAGKVDNHWGDVFGAAMLGTLVNVGAATADDPDLVISGVGRYGGDPVDTALSEGVQRTASTVTNRVVDRGLATPPTIRVEAGARVFVIVTRRLVLRP